MKHAWSIREYREGDERGILELTEAVYGKVPDREQWLRWWHWMYKDNPAGTGKIWLADHAGKVVGQYALIFENIKVGNEILKACQNIDDMTHPDYRYQGIYSKLERRALDEAGKAGVHITYGFPNDAAYPGHIKSGFFDLCSLQTMIKPLNLENILGKRIPNKFLAKICTVIGNLAVNLLYRTGNPPRVNDLAVTTISSFDDRINDLWSKVSDDYEIIGVRDKEYLNWRYVNIPNVEYTTYVAEKQGQILGYIVLRCRELRNLVCGYIFDLIAPLDQEKIIQCLVSKAVEHFKQEKADFILCQMIGPKVYRNIFRKSGFISPHFISRRFRFIVYINTPKISATFVKNPRHWFVQIGDSDAI